MKTFKQAIAGLLALVITSANTAAMAQSNIGAEDLVERSTSVITQLTGNGVQILDATGKSLSSAEAIRTRDFYMKSPDSKLAFRARLSHSGNVTTIALGAYDNIGGNRLAARTVLVDPTKSHAENNLLIDQTIQSLALQVEKYAANKPKQKRSFATEKIALPFVGLIKIIVSLGFLMAAVDVTAIMSSDGMKSQKFLKRGSAAVALALGYVIIDRYFTEPNKHNR